MRKPIGRTIDTMTGPNRPRQVRNTGRRVDDRPPEPIDPAFRDLVMRGLEQSRRGEVASDEEVRAVFASFRQ